MEDKNRLPIGFFDSGIGGLSVLCCALRELPREDFIFFGDSANAPYGEKTEEQIKQLSLACGEFLCDKGVKAIVVACNTATSASVILMREKYRLPVISMEPAVKPASAVGTGKIIVMATPATIAGERYKRLVARVGCGDRVIDMPCGGLVQLLETGDFAADSIDSYIRRKFADIREDIDAIVIGCTHYSFVAGRIEAIAKELLHGQCHIVDGMYGTIRQLKRVLAQEGLENGHGSGHVSCYSSLGGESAALYEKIIRDNI